MVRGFGVGVCEAAIGLFLVHHALKPGVVHCGFGAEHHHVGGIENFTFVKHVGAARRFGNARFAFIAAGNDKVPRLGVGA